MRTTDTVCPICGDVGDHIQLETREGDDAFIYRCHYCGGIHDGETEVLTDYRGNPQTRCSTCGKHIAAEQDIYRQPHGWDSTLNRPAWYLVHAECYEE